MEKQKNLRTSIIADWFSVNLAATNAKSCFDNPGVAAYLFSAAAFIDAAISLIDSDNDFRRLHNGNEKNTCDTAATSQD